MDDWIGLVRALADDPDEVEIDGPDVLLPRRGEEILLSLKNVPGDGLSVAAGEITIPFATYIQREVLKLDKLAAQISRTLEANAAQRPVPFIEGPAVFEQDSGQTMQVSKSGQHLRDYLESSLPNTTKLLQLMAGAGYGKTVLLESVSLQLAKRYMPDPHPTPLLLPVDLLGRYVGNIDDAIAGTLNNTFMFPNLTQTDVVLAAKKNWITIALDGFDELVSRIGARDAFNRINELLDQLSGSGTLILSARSNFFHLYQISSAIRTYLKPRTGSYHASRMELQPWTEDQGVAVFRALESAEPALSYQSIASLFENDEAVLYQPFLLTRIAKLWVEGERFPEVEKAETSFSRMDLVIRYYLKREADEKWVGRDRNPLISVQGHYHLLGGIASEMWRAQAFALDLEELRLSAEIALEGINEHHQAEEISERIPTHAALVEHSNKYAFINDQLLYFFLSWSLARSIENEDRPDVVQLIEASELTATILVWTMVHIQNLSVDPATAIEFLSSLTENRLSDQARANLGALLGSVLQANVETLSPLTGAQIHGVTFMGDNLKGFRVSGMQFFKCEFWNCDFEGSEFVDCTFTNCSFGKLRVSSGTRFSETYAKDCEFTAVEADTGESRYSPQEVLAFLGGLGMLGDSQLSQEESLPLARSSQDALVAVDKLVKLSMRSWEFAETDVVNSVRSTSVDGAELLQAATASGILRKKAKSTSGRPKDFYKFSVDRDAVLSAHSVPSENQAIEEFWAYLADKYPP